MVRLRTDHISHAGLGQHLTDIQLLKSSNALEKESLKLHAKPYCIKILTTPSIFGRDATPSLPPKKEDALFSKH